MFDKASKHRFWHQANAREIKVFMRITLYMRIYLLSEMTDYWSTDVENGPAHLQVTQNMLF